jgi:hypothetical protein
MKSCLRLLVLLLLVGSCVYATPPTGSSGFRFTQNQGQYVTTNQSACPDVLFKAQGAGSDIYLTRQGISYVLVSMDRTEEAFHDMAGEMAEKLRMQSATMRLERLDMHFVGANPNATIAHGAALPSYDNFYYAHCPDGITNVPSFDDITYKDIYPHIDWHVTGRDGQLKTEFIVHPGGDPQDIQMRIGGAQSQQLLADGSLEITGLTGHVNDAAPVALQGTAQIAVQYVQDGANVHFQVAGYDAQQDLVIDPYTRVYSTFFGSSGNEWYLGHVTATDQTGNMYLAGHTSGTNFPATAGMYQTANAGANDGFVAKFTNAGARTWCTYYGGSSSEGGIAFQQCLVCHCNLQLQFSRDSWLLSKCHVGGA